MSKNNTLHMIGHGHIDPVWLWRWQEGYHEVHATFRSALDRMKEFDDFTFTSSSAAFYAWAEEMDPAMFTEIQQRVAEGRWHFTGGWWIEPDCNIPAGESFVRQGLYGQRFFQEKFGRKATEGFNPDSFGHHAVFPQILKKQGMDHYVFMRPGPHEKTLPSRIFWWEADDGSRVLCFRIIRSYNDWDADMMSQINAASAELVEPFHDMMCFYGVGNHGGGPTIRNIQEIHRFQQDASLPVMRFSSSAEFFAALDIDPEAIPVVHDDLQHHASGCYAAHSGVKRWNRQAENALVAAEKWAAAAQAVLGTPYPRMEFSRAWKLVLFNQFHDIMAGSSIKEAYLDAERTYGEATSIAERAQNRALQAFTWQIDLPHGDAKPLVVFNPHGWQARVPVEVEGHLGGSQFAVTDAAGSPVTVQLIQPHMTLNRAIRLRFLADLPPLGYQVYWVRPVPGEQNGYALPVLSTVLESDMLRLEIDPETGWIASLVERHSQNELFNAPAAVPVVIDDPSDTWSHGVFTFDRVIGHFTLDSMQMIDDGPVQSTLRVKSHYGHSSVTQDFTLYKAMPRIDVRVQVDWQEQHKMLKLQFPVNVENPTATYEVPYGHIVRPCNGTEEAGQRWVDISGSGLGVSFLNDGKYSFNVKDNVFGLTVLRSPIYAHHDPKVPEADFPYDYMDQGLQSFTYSILPHQGDWRMAGTVRAAAEINQAVPVLITTGHAGKLPLTAGWVGETPRNVDLVALKGAEDGSGWVVRLVETNGIPCQFDLELPLVGSSIPVRIGAYEIQTIRIEPDGSSRVVNLLEE
ncbi:MAG: alpha-mannosidase [Anaerolineae bacterium]|nr:alpha-mannosidase [Anaerolineae bacterium]